MEYLERHVVAKFILHQIGGDGVEVESNCRVAVKDDAVGAAINLAIEQAGSQFLHSLGQITMRVDSEPGEGPMILTTLTYFELTEGLPMENFSFEVHDNEFIEPGKAREALAQVSTQAANLFKRKLATLLEGGAL